MGEKGTGEIPVEVYDNLYKQFNPVKFNAKQWVSIARAAGMKYMVLTAKHCDGFCMWQSSTDPYCMTNTPFTRDVCKETRRRRTTAGLHMGWYYSPMDWRDPDCRTERNGAYLTRMRNHLRELLGRYGKIDLLWFDTDGGPAPWDQEHTYALVRSLQPSLIINNRLDMGSQEDYKAQRILPNADYDTPEQRIGAFDDEHPWETCMTIGTQWSWKPNDTIKTSDECIRILVQCVSGDGNLLLNVGPMPNGEIEPRQATVLKEDRGVAEEIWREHLRYPRRPIPKRIVGWLNQKGEVHLSPHHAMEGRPARAAASERENQECHCSFRWKAGGEANRRPYCGHDARRPGREAYHHPEA